MTNYSKYTTDKERVAIAPSVPPMLYPMLLDWEAEATDEEARMILHSYAHDAYHLECD